MSGVPVRVGEGGGWLAICNCQARKEEMVSQTGFEPATHCLEGSRLSLNLLTVLTSWIASELMDYLLRNPGEVRGWVDKEKRFDSLGRIRRTLPHPKFRKQPFDLLNENTHASVRNIDALSTYLSGPDRRTLAVGPLPFSPTENDSINMAASFISYPTRTMWQSDPDAVSADWV